MVVVYVKPKEGGWIDFTRVLFSVSFYAVDVWNALFYAVLT